MAFMSRDQLSRPREHHRDRGAGHVFAEPSQVLSLLKTQRLVDEGVMTVGYGNDDDQKDLTYVIALITLMLATLSTYTDLVSFFRG